MWCYQNIKTKVATTCLEHFTILAYSTLGVPSRSPMNTTFKHNCHRLESTTQHHQVDQKSFRQVNALINLKRKSPPIPNLTGNPWGVGHLTIPGNVNMRTAFSWCRTRERAIEKLFRNPSLGKEKSGWRSWRALSIRENVTESVAISSSIRLPPPSIPRVFYWLQFPVRTAVKTKRRSGQPRHSACSPYKSITVSTSNRKLVKENLFVHSQEQIKLVKPR